jgi:hypothetical protein
MARTRDAINLRRETCSGNRAVLPLRAEEQSGNRRGGVLRLALSVSAAVADDLWSIPTDERK